MFRPALAIAAALVAPAVAALAGDITPVETGPAVTVPAVPTPAPVTRGADWTGFYVGMQTGYGNYEQGAGSPSGTVYGIHAGYLYNFGTLVAGGELRYDDLSQVADNLTMTSGQLRLGYDMGRVLPYVSLGGAWTNRPSPGGNSASGLIYGLGADFAVTDHWRVGAEATHSDLDVDGGGSLGGTNLGVSVSFSF